MAYGFGSIWWSISTSIVTRRGWCGVVLHGCGLVRQRCHTVGRGVWGAHGCEVRWIVGYGVGGACDTREDSVRRQGITDMLIPAGVEQLS